MIFRRYIDDKDFYKSALVIAAPIMLQNGITNFVSMLDNIMVGLLGTIPMSGVAISNQLLFVFLLCVFGAVSGAGLFGAQFFGKGDQTSIRYCFRFRLVFALLLTCAAIFLFWFEGDFFISLFLKGEGSASDAAAIFSAAKSYLRIMLIGLIPYSIAQCYSSVLKEMGRTVLPMIAGVIAVGVNLLFNWVLIFGHLGAPRLGANGAAIATVISRFVEMFIVAIYVHSHKTLFPFVKGLYKSFYIPLPLCKKITAKAVPLLLNETLWSAGMASLNQCYSLHGLDVVAATNISQTFWNLFSVTFMATGHAIGIIIGQLLGAGEFEKAKESNRKLVSFSVILALTFGIFYAACSPFIPHLYNTSSAVMSVSTKIMLISALFMPFHAFCHSCYFTLRSGGKTLITFIFDSGSIWFVSLPLALVLSHFTSADIFTVYFCCQTLDVIKCIFGKILVEKGSWVRDITT